MQAGQLRHFLPLVEKVVAQTKERVWGGNTHVADKVLSLFEPHTQVIRKGKAHKPNEFGRLLRVDEVENGIVSGYEVLEGNAADTNSWLPAIENHMGFQLGCILGPRGVRCIEVWGQTGTWAIWCSG